MVFFEYVITYIKKKSIYILSRKEYFPSISIDNLKKYRSFDPYLGWTNKENSTKVDFSQNKTIEYKFNSSGSRDLEVYFKNNSFVSTYGDSYCMSREVENKKTWQFFLSKNLNSGVSNYGVGNYGFDQSLLRLKKKFDLNPSSIVIMAITPYTINRITSVWKHFHEFNNILAAKPRFIIENNKLKFVPNFINNKNDFLNIKKFKNFIIENDYHVFRFQKFIYDFPNLFSFLRNPIPIFKTLYFKFILITKKLNLNYLFSFFYLKFYNDEISYRKTVFKNNSDLLTLLIEDYVKFSKEKNFTPILLLLPALEDVKYIKSSSDNYYNPYFNLGNKNLIFLDFLEVLIDRMDLEKLYVDEIFGGHYNQKGNELLAKYLQKKINEIKTDN